MVRKEKDEITYPFPNFNGCMMKVSEWIWNLILHFLMNLITYPSGISQTTLEKWALSLQTNNNYDKLGMVYCSNDLALRQQDIT